MANLTQLLQNAQTAEERARILKEELSRKKDHLGMLNGGVVLEMDEYEGLHVGDKVRFVNVWGEPAEGYLSHFFLNLQDAPGLQVAEMCRQRLAEAEGRPSECKEQSFRYVIVPVGSSGYSTHHGSSLPQKLTE